MSGAFLSTLFRVSTFNDTSYTETALLYEHLLASSSHLLQMHFEITAQPIDDSTRYALYTSLR
jgi:hypothetical protein